MAVHYKFKSAKDFDSISIEGHFITVGNLKDKIFESKQLGKGKDYDLVVINAHTNEEYLDEATLIPKNSSVLIRRLPALPQKPIVTAPATNEEEQVVENRHESASKTSFQGAGQFATDHVVDLDDDQFGNELYDIPEGAPGISINPVNAPNKAEEDEKIQALVNTPALDWNQTFDCFGSGRGFGRGSGGRGSGRGAFEWQKPPEGYVCYRCKMPGHFIQHCPTNGDPNFDIKRVKPPTGIPRSMLVATPDGSYILPSGDTAVLKPNDAAFEKEIEGMPTARRVNELPPELHCPLCKQVMKDAALTSTCCLRSFCYECIRDQIISKAKCVCGATDILADNLLPNHTVRDTIRGILETNNNSSPAKGGQAQSQHVGATKTQGSAKESPVVQPEALEERKLTKVLDVSETANDLRNVEEPALQGSGIPAEGKAQHTEVAVEAAKKKKKKKVKLPTNVGEMQWEFAVESYGPFSYNPYWNVMHLGMEAYMNPYCGVIPPFMGYGPVGVPGMIPPPIPPQRDLVEPGKHMNDEPPIMTREEFEARKAELKHKHRLEVGGQSRRSFKYQESQREVGNSGDVSSNNLKSISPPASVHRRRHHLSLDRHSGERKQQPSQRKSSHGYNKETPAAGEDRNQKKKSSVFSRIKFAGKDEEKCRSRRQMVKSSSIQGSDFGGGRSRKDKKEEELYHHRHKASSRLGDYESSEDEYEDDERHVKRRRRRYSPSPVKDNRGGRSRGCR